MQDRGRLAVKSATQKWESMILDLAPHPMYPPLTI